MEINTTLDIEKMLENMENVNEKVEYFRKKGKLVEDQIHKADDGQKILKLGDGKRGRGPLKGVMIAYTNGDDDIVRIGFSMCHSIDEWDHVDGVYQPGFGKYIASERSDKWVSKTKVTNHKTVQSVIDVNGGMDDAIKDILKDTVVIPDSMYERFRAFVTRCRKYYKDKQFPEWVSNL